MEYSYLAAGASESVRLVHALNCAPFYRVQLIIRIHSLTISTGQSFAFVLANTLPSEIDPREFSESASFLTVTINSSSPAAPSLVSGTATDPGAFLKLTMTASQPAGGSSPLYGEFSGVVVLRRP